jgi:cysteine desulfurase
VTQEGLYDWDWLASQMVSAPALLSLLHINNETGVVQDLALAYSWRLRFPRLVLHVDWVQSQGKWPLDLRLVPPDLLTCSAHKVHGLRGCALLYVRHGLELDPLVVGGAQEKFRRAGTSDVAAAAAYAEAVRQLPPPGSTWPHLRLLEDTILRHLDESGVSFILHGPTQSPVPKESHPPRRMPGILNMAFPAMANKEDLLIALDLEGICASATSACHSGVVSDSHVLQAMGLPAKERAASIRLALAAHQTPEDAARVADALVRAVRRAETLPRPSLSDKS